MFLAALEATVVGTAMPTVIASLGGLELYSWVFSAYLLTSTVTVPAWGKLSDIHGRRPLYLAAIAIFLIGSILSGQVQSMTQLIVFRAIQGLGAGGLMPLSMTISAELYTPVERAKIQGLFSGVWGLASIVGPLAGGIITEQINWRWVFYINIPFGLVAALIVGTQLIEDASNRRRRRVDVVGISLFTMSITLLMLLLVRSETSFDLSSPMTLFLLGGSVVLMLLFVRAERGAEEPLLPMDLFRNRVFSGAAANGFLAGMAMFGLVSFIPLFVQGVIGTGATAAGSVLTPLLLAWVLFSVLGGRLLLRIPFRTVMVVGMVLMSVGFLLLDLMTAASPIRTVLINAGLVGSGMGLVMICQLIAVQSAVPRERLGIATSTAHFCRSIGGAVGVAVMGTVMTQRMNRQLIDAGGGGELAELVKNPNVFLEPATRALLSPDVTAVFQAMLANALYGVFIVGTLVSLIGLVAVAVMPPVRLSHTDP
jgi:EmrB/QacA subfamily drug resistance transporter